ncbi:MAG: hypothetical protein LUD47_01625 [Clostridia bacterium]|nr:hypothetical protein [Clostridia bacterium]
MEELVFATVHKEIQAAFAQEISDKDLILLLYDAIISPLNLLNKNGETIDISVKTASAIVNRKPGGEVLETIRIHSNAQKVKDTINDYFQNYIVSELLDTSVDDMIEHLKKIIEGDDEISNLMKQDLNNLGNKETLAQFLSNVFLYSLSRKNVIHTKNRGRPKKVITPNSTPEKYKQIKIEEILFAETPTKEEKTYIDALLHEYGQLEGLSQISLMQVDSTYPNYKKDLTTQRTYYYAAEAVRRGTRDIYSNGENQFDCLKNEMYEGIIEVWDERYKNGQTRMRNVFKQACLVSLDGCFLCKETTLVGNSQRKGVCHFLVNDGRINGWVRDDDDDSVQQ